MRYGFMKPEVRKQLSKRTVRKYVIEMKEESEAGDIGQRFAELIGVSSADVIVLEGCTLHVIDVEPASK